MIDILFKQVFFQLAYLRNNIFYHVANDINYNTVAYEYCYDVGWMIKNNHLKLLVYKLKNNEYLYFDDHAMELMYEINDLDLFVQCYKRSLTDYTTIVINPNQSKEYSDHPLIQAAYKRNHSVVHYLLQQQDKQQLYKSMNSYDELDFLALVIKMADIELCRFSLKHIKVLAEERFYVNAIQTKDIEIIRLVFDAPRKHSFKMDHSRAKLLILAMDTLDLEIFILVRHYIQDTTKSFLSIFRKEELLFTEDILWELVDRAVRSFSLFKYMTENFNLVFISQLNTRNCRHPFMDAVKYQQKDVIDYLIKHGLAQDQHIKMMASAALTYGHFDLYAFIQQSFNLPFTPLPSGFTFSDKQNLSNEKLNYLFQTLSFSIRKQDVYSSINVSTDLFKYIFNKSDTEFRKDKEFIDSILKRAISKSNSEIIIFLYQQGICLDSLWKSFESFSWDQSQPLQFIDTLLNNLPSIGKPTGNLFGNTSKFQDLLAQNHDFKLFKKMYDRFHQSLDSNYLFKTAAGTCRIQTIKYIHNKSICGVCEIDKKNMHNLFYISLHKGYLSILKFIGENYIVDKENDVSFENIIESLFYSLIKNNNLNCIKYLLDDINSFKYILRVVSIRQLFSALSNRSNLLMIKYFFDHPDYIIPQTFIDDDISDYHKLVYFYFCKDKPNGPIRQYLEKEKKIPMTY